MDPKSLASNTAALLALTIQVTGALYRDWDRNSEPTVERLSYELTRLRNILASLEEVALQSEQPVLLGELPMMFTELPMVFRALRTALVRLGSKLFADGENRDIPSLRTLIMTWEPAGSGKKPRILPLSKREGENIFNDLQVQIARLKSLADFTDDSATTMVTGDLSLSAFWKYSAGYNDIHNKSQGDRVQGSGAWLLRDEKFRRWMETNKIDPERQENVLYCSGRPGSGKTILASTVIDELRPLRRQANVGLAYFYFSYRNKTPILNVTLALLEQLYYQSSTLAIEVQGLAKRSPDPTKIPLSELINVLVSVLGRFRKTYIVLDALDECSGDARSDLGALLSKLRASSARLFVTTRPSHDLSDFDRCPSIQISPSAEDMRLFVRQRLRKISQQRNVFSKAQEASIMIALVGMGSKHGMFLLVELQLNSISELFEQGVPDDFNLEDNLSKLTGNLTEVYDEQMKRITATQNADSKIARRILSWLYYNTGSMPADALQNILQKEVDSWVEKPSAPVDVRFMGKVCLDLVRHNPVTHVVAFFHFSFHEYLESKNTENKRLEHRDVPEATLPAPAIDLAEACIGYLLQPELAGPVSSPDRIKRRLQEFPFYEYAATNWGTLLGHEDHINFDAPSLTSLLRSKERKLAVSEVLFRSEPRFFETLEANRFSALHWITYHGLLRRRSPFPLYIAETEVYARDFQGRTPLHIAAMRGHSVSLKVLIGMITSDRSSDAASKILASPDSTQRNVWHHAAEGDHPNVINILITQHLRSAVSVMQIARKDNNERTPLRYAAAGGHLEIVSKFLQHGLHHEDTELAFWDAIRGGHTNVVEALLSFGIMPQYEHLVVAINGGAENLVKLLLDYGVDIYGKDAGSALHEATRAGKKSILSNLIWNGADLETTDSASRTPLLIAIENGDVDTVRILLDAGSNPEIDILETAGDRKVAISAALWAATHGKADIFRLLRRAGADCSSALFPAIENGHFKIVSQILESNAAPRLDGEYKTKAIALAAERGHVDIAHLLEHWETRKKPHARNNTSVTGDNEPGELNRVETWVEQTVYLEEPENDVKTLPARSRGSSATESAGTIDIGDSQGSSLGDTRAVIPKKDTSKEVGVIVSPVVGGIPVGVELATGSRPAPQILVPKPRRSSKSPYAMQVSSKSTPRLDRVPSAPFILLEAPLVTGHIPLGSLVRDPKNPLGTRGPVDPELDNLVPAGYIHEIHQDSFEMRVGKTKETQAAVGIAGSVGAELSHMTESQVMMRSPHVWRQQLDRHAEILDNILKSSGRIGADYRWFLQHEKEVFMVVGLFIMEDSEVAYGDDSGNTNRLPAALAGFKLGSDLAARRSTKIASRYRNALIHGIQYRRVRVTKPFLGRLLPERKREMTIELGGYVEGADHITLF